MSARFRKDREPRFRGRGRPFPRLFLRLAVGLVSAVALFYLIVLITAWWPSLR